jgi:hypothetical protein
MEETVLLQQRRKRYSAPVSASLFVFVVAELALRLLRLEYLALPGRFGTQARQHHGNMRLHPSDGAAPAAATDSMRLLQRHGMWLQWCQSGQRLIVRSSSILCGMAVSAHGCGSAMLCFIRSGIGCRQKEIVAVHFLRVDCPKGRNGRLFVRASGHCRKRQWEQLLECFFR